MGVDLAMGVCREIGAFASIALSARKNVPCKLVRGRFQECAFLALAVNGFVCVRNGL